MSSLMSTAQRVYFPVSAEDSTCLHCGHPRHAHIAATSGGPQYCPSVARARAEFETAMSEHITETNSPQQCGEFRRIMEQMYSTHLDKNADYSKYNMLATGEIGAITRLWDKMARLMSLYGFDIETGKLSPPKQPKNESVDDTLLDLANYAIILRIMRAGKWGK